MVRHSTAGTKEEAVQAGPQHGSLPLVTLKVEHANSMVGLSVDLTPFGVDPQTAVDRSLWK